MGDKIREVVEAARSLLDRIDTITTDDFQVGGERAERERLRAALDKLDEPPRYEEPKAYVYDGPPVPTYFPEKEKIGIDK